MTGRIDIDYALAAAVICSAGKDTLPDGVGCLVLTFDFGNGGRMGYASMGSRDDCIQALREFLSNFEDN
jgi:hypothetical protein